MWGFMVLLIIEWCITYYKILIILSISKNNDKYVFIRPDKKFYQVVTLPTDDTFILKFEGIGPSKKEISVIKYFIRE